MKHRGRPQLGTSRSWAKRGSATLAAGAASTLGANAAVVQITLTDNYLTESLNNLNADISGDGVLDLNLSGANNTENLVTFIAGPNTSFNIAASANLGAYGRAAAQFFEGGFPYFIGLVGIPFSAATAPLIYPNGYAIEVDYGPATPDDVSARALYPISFTDPVYGGAIEAWLDIESIAASVPDTTARVSLLRVIWDDQNLAFRPQGLAATDAAFPEAQPVPEPSGIALLSLGAGGLLTRRRRKVT